MLQPISEQPEANSVFKLSTLPVFSNEKCHCHIYCLCYKIPEIYSWQNKQQHPLDESQTQFVTFFFFLKFHPRKKFFLEHIKPLFFHNHIIETAITVVVFFVCFFPGKSKLAL